MERKEIFSDIHPDNQNNKCFIKCKKKNEEVTDHRSLNLPNGIALLNDTYLVFVCFVLFL